MIRLILLRVLEAFFRHRWSYAVIIGAAMLVGVLVFILVPADYQVRGTIYVQRESLLTTLASDRQVRQFTTPSQATLSEITSLLNTETFALTVLNNTDLRERVNESRRELEEVLIEYRRDVFVSAEGSNIVVISAQNPNPYLAQQLAAETMKAYVDWRVNFERADSATAQRFFAEQITLYEEQLARAERELRDYLLLYPDPVRGGRSSEEVFEIERLQRAITEASDRVSDARDKEEDARLALAKVNSDSFQEYLVIDAPAVPNSPPSVLRRAVLILGVFTVLGVILAAVRLALAIITDRTFHFPTDVRYGVHQPTLAMLPFQGKSDTGRSRKRKAAEAQTGNPQTTGSTVSPAKSS